MRNTVKQLKQLKQLIRESIKQVLLEEYDDFNDWKNTFDNIFGDHVYEKDQKDYIIDIIDHNNLNPQDVFDYMQENDKYDKEPSFQDLMTEIAEHYKIQMPQKPEEYNILEDQDWIELYGPGGQYETDETKAQFNRAQAKAAAKAKGY